ncbi:uncharacterized protein LOC143285541 isoform X2 [Babylonia areolata]|uniref:uncharacterized protein LOC143285541 isoform X2 n=1 Tax=Babylonia areolata TaxID=304850 RepID=UPI003FD037B2
MSFSSSLAETVSEKDLLSVGLQPERHYGRAGQTLDFSNQWSGPCRHGAVSWGKARVGMVLCPGERPVSAWCCVLGKGPCRHGVVSWGKARYGMVLCPGERPVSAWCCVLGKGPCRHGVVSWGKARVGMVLCPGERPVSAWCCVLGKGPCRHGAVSWRKARDSFHPEVNGCLTWVKEGYNGRTRGLGPAFLYPAVDTVDMNSLPRCPQRPWDR